MDLFCFLFFFFFKQKTAYEMRISDWSSDVCSSDLPSSTPIGGPFCVPIDIHRAVAADKPHNNGLAGGAPPTLAARTTTTNISQIGRASCRERVCQYV